MYKRQKQGYKINIEQAATRPGVLATRMISMEEIANNVSFVIKEDNRILNMDTNTEKDLKENLIQLRYNHERDPMRFTRAETEKRMAHIVAQSLQKKADTNGLNVEVFINDSGMLTVMHKHHGSKPNFGISTNITCLLYTSPSPRD